MGIKKKNLLINLIITSDMNKVLLLDNITVQDKFTAGLRLVLETSSVEELHPFKGVLP